MVSVHKVKGGRDSDTTTATVIVIYIMQHLLYQYIGKRVIISYLETVSNRAFP